MESLHIIFMNTLLQKRVCCVNALLNKKVTSVTVIALYVKIVKFINLYLLHFLYYKVQGSEETAFLTSLENAGFFGM